MSRLVVKIGGHALDDLSVSSVALRALAEDVVTLRGEGVDVVLVHGGGPQIAELLASVGLVSEFHEGLRVTSTQTMHYVAMALARVNVSLVAALSHHGLACVGLMGVDGGLIRGESLGAPWDRAGSVSRVDCDVLKAQWDGGFVPVIGSVALDDHGELINCNADVVAGAIAGALGATTLVLLSDIDQLRADPDDAASALSHVRASHVHEMIASGAARDGMRPKMTAAVDALSAGAQRVLLANGTRPHALRDVAHDKVPTTEVLA